jgi:hypothetical protein
MVRRRRSRREPVRMLGENNFGVNRSNEILKVIRPCQIRTLFYRAARVRHQIQRLEISCVGYRLLALSFFSSLTTLWVPHPLRPARSHIQTGLIADAKGGGNKASNANHGVNQWGPSSFAAFAGSTPFATNYAVDTYGIQCLMTN